MGPGVPPVMTAGIESLAYPIRRPVVVPSGCNLLSAICQSGLAAFDVARKSPGQKRFQPGIRRGEFNQARLALV
jgi:hypothetical protein